MKAAVLRVPGGLDRIEVRDIPDPGQPGPGQIRIALHATSLNYHDLLVANGGHPAADGRILMSDGAGVVEAVGERRGGVPARRPCRFLLLPSMAGWAAQATGGRLHRHAGRWHRRLRRALFGTGGDGFHPRATRLETPRDKEHQFASRKCRRESTP